LKKKETQNASKTSGQKKSFLLFAAQVMKKKKELAFVQQDKSTV
jgi:hypothetical protein